MKLLLGTTNSAKISDYKKYLVRFNLEIVTLHEIGFSEECLEIGKTFEENALQKAKFYAEKTEYPSLSDDGGFEVDFLDGRPGIESNRWLGPEASDQDKIEEIIRLLKGVSMEKRTARLTAVTMVYFPEVRDYIEVHGSIEGVVPENYSKKIIAKLPYRSVLFLPEKGKFYSELNEEELEGIDHRKKICRELLLKLEPYINN